MSRGSYQPMPPQWTDVSKMLALEVKDIMNEVSKLKEERNRIQQEIADLINVRSKMAAGFPPEMWGLFQSTSAIAPPPAPEPAPPPAETSTEIVAARPAWRTVEQRPSGPKRKARGMTKQEPVAAPPPPPPIPAAIEAPKPSWANWRPSPAYAIQHSALAAASPPPPPAPKAAPPPPKKIGLFGEE